MHSIISPQITQIDADDISKVWVFICVICVICGQMGCVGGFGFAFGYAVTIRVSSIQDRESGGWVDLESGIWDLGSR